MFTSKWVVAFPALQSVVRAVVEVAILNKVTAEGSDKESCMKPLISSPKENVTKSSETY